ncbi:MAG: SDR family NAD(P)-dependent oxidoreductase [Hyphomicrobiales bacterium]
MSEFKGKTVVVSGALGNLGKAVAARMAQDGAKLVLLGRDRGALQSLSAALPGSHLNYAVDLLDHETVTAAIDNVNEELSTIDILLAMAGGFTMGPKVHETSAADWQKMQDMNVGTLLPLLASVAPRMINAGQGKIVTVGAYAALKGNASMGAYAAAKSAVMRITESSAAELKGYGINVNGVLPTVLNTPENRAAMPNADPQNWVSPERLADVIAFLASSESDDMYGALLPVVGKS